MDATSTSAWLPLVAFTAWRGIALVYLVASFAYFCTVGLHFQFFTVITYEMEILSFALLFCASVVLYAGLGRNWTLYPAITTNFFHAVASATLYLDIMYWLLLSQNSSDKTSFRNIGLHGINFVIVLLEFAMGGHVQFRLLGLFWVVLYPLVWVFLVAWPWWATRDEWIYGFLDFNKHSTGYIVGIYLGVTALSLISGFLFLVLSRIVARAERGRPIPPLTNDPSEQA